MLCLVLRLTISLSSRGVQVLRTFLEIAAPAGIANQVVPPAFDDEGSELRLKAVDVGLDFLPVVAHGMLIRLHKTFRLGEGRCNVRFEVFEGERFVLSVHGWLVLLLTLSLSSREVPALRTFSTKDPTRDDSSLRHGRINHAL